MLSQVRPNQTESGMMKFKRQELINIVLRSRLCIRCILSTPDAVAPSQ